MNRKNKLIHSVNLLVFFVLFLTPIMLSGQANGSFRLFFHNMMAQDFANWSYDIDDPGYFHGDGNPFTWNVVNPVFHTYAYYRFGRGGISEYSCLQENLPFANGPEDIDVGDYTDFCLTGFSKINTVNPLGMWGVFGQSGEARTYVADYYLITCGFDGLVLNNIQLDAILPYATKETMRANLLALGYAGAQNWQTDMGTGLPVTGHGRADINVGASTPAFLAAMDNGTHQIEFDVVAFNYLIQGATGYYDMTIDVYPAPVAQNIANPAVILAGPFPQQFHLPAVDLDIEVFAATGGGLAADQNNIWINQVPVLPAKALPDGIAELAPVFWDITTTLDTYQMNITFDLTDILPFGDPANWRLCKRDNEFSAWVVYDNILVAGNTITALGVVDLSEWAVGSTEATLPVELSSFTALVNSENLVNLQWTTQSETNLSGYGILRNKTADLGTALDLNQFIEASNSSTSHTYSFVEETALEPGTYYYWLQALELNGESSFHGPVSVIVTEEGGSNPPPVPTPAAQLSVYPNPFNPVTQIGVYLPSQKQGQCTIYNPRGELVYQYAPQSFSEGWTHLTWNGTDKNGKACGSGVYLVKVTGKGLNLHSKLVLMK